MIEPSATVSRHNPSTSLSLLERAKSNDHAAWVRLCELYSPLVYQWCKSGGVGESYIPDVAQNVFLAVLRGLAGFKREETGGTFRGWLRTVTRHRIIDHVRSQQQRPNAAGGSDFRQQMAEVAFAEDDPAIELAEGEELAILYRKALALIEAEFPAWYKAAFVRVVINEENATDVANEIQKRPSALYNMKARVLRRLREEFAEVIE